MEDHGTTPVKVTVHIPSKVREDVRRQKINRIYDILTGAVHLGIAPSADLRYTKHG